MRTEKKQTITRVRAARLAMKELPSERTMVHKVAFVGQGCMSVPLFAILAGGPVLLLSWLGTLFPERFQPFPFFGLFLVGAFTGFYAFSKANEMLSAFRQRKLIEEHERFMSDDFEDPSPASPSGAPTSF